MTLKPRSLGQKAWDFLGLPFRLLLFDQDWLPAWGWTTLEEERLAAVLPHVEGRLLDIGAGPNRLVKLHGRGRGVDIYDWGGGALVVADCADLPFDSASFDTVTMIACLNHIPNRLEVLREARRCLVPRGKLLITMINPLLGGVGHTLWWYSEDKKRGGMAPGERGGLWNREVIDLGAAAGFNLVSRRRFVYGLNNLLIFRAAEPGVG